ncbi:cytochrome c [Gluconobacter kondonii]|uniref:c-type cytochrome n=1 Tax=Gluconobacter kondonii TaxID=941463 RepID=UPI001B8D5CA6|nr:cytochrome c [Gluconobacter kondonii]MBS1077051.1 cytochrome c [Gluconobacter kondonii]
MPDFKTVFWSFLVGGTVLAGLSSFAARAADVDQDVHALYVWFMNGVKPVAQTPPATQLSFPSNIRLTLSGWNMLAGTETQETGDSASYDRMRRGRYLAIALEHCGTCHTPRNVMLMEKSDQYLAGSPLSGWYAPNITPSKTGGIGDWSEDDLVQYLRTGRAKGRSQAAGPMGEAVEHSTSHLTDADLHALAAFVLQVKALDDASDTQPRDGFGKANDIPDLRSGNLTPIDNLSQKAPENLFDANCAACHGQNGAGTVDQYAPSLYKNSVVGAGRPDNLIMTILTGVNRKTADGHASMPAFGSTSDVQRLDDTEVASLVNYVNKTFGSGTYTVTADQVAKVRKDHTPH